MAMYCYVNFSPVATLGTAAKKQKDKEPKSFFFPRLEYKNKVPKCESCTFLTYIFHLWSFHRKNNDKGHKKSAEKKFIPGVTSRHTSCGVSSLPDWLHPNTPVRDGPQEHSDRPSRSCDLQRRDGK